MLNRIELIGVLKQKPRLRETTSGQAVINPILMLEDRTGPRPVQVKVTLFGDAAVELDKVAQAGMLFYMEGRFIFNAATYDGDCPTVMGYNWKRLDPYAPAIGRLLSQCPAERAEPE